MDKQSSDALASTASRIQRTGSPLKDRASIMDLVQKVRQTAAAAGDEAATQHIHDHFHDFCEDAVSLAGSVMAQADGPEDSSDCGA